MSDIMLTYPIVIRVVRGHVIASQAELGIHRVRGRFEAVKHREEIGSIILDIWSEIARMTAEKGFIRPELNPLVSGTRAQESISTHDAGKLLGVSRETVRKLCKAGKIKCFQTPGGHNRIRICDLPVQN